MKPVFADTAYFLALLNPGDQLHRQARALNQQPSARCSPPNSSPPRWETR